MFSNLEMEKLAYLEQITFSFVCLQVMLTLSLIFKYIDVKSKILGKIKVSLQFYIYFACHFFFFFSFHSRPIPRFRCDRI